MADTPRLALTGLDKSFGPARVLSGVDLFVAPGEVHGLAGQNGSGKSTLVKVLTGIHEPDPGARLEIDGQPVRLPVRWPEVHRAGISVVHQDLGLLDELSVSDNICVGGFPRDPLTRRIDRSRQHELARRSMERVGADIDPGRRAGSLDGPERAAVAVARALRDHRDGAGLVIMDESTRALTGAALERMHDILRSLAARGTSVLLISHSLPELLAVTDRVTILRDGGVAGGGLPTSGLTEHDIATRMLGAGALFGELELTEAARPTPVAAPDAGQGHAALEVRGLTGLRVRDVSLSVARGEIVGITGLPGSGFEDLPYLMACAAGPRDGVLVCDGTTLELRTTSIAQCLRAGLVLVPEQRGTHGLALELSVRDNLNLPNFRRRGRPWFLSRRWQDEDATTAVDAYGIRPGNVAQVVKSLSGGNQQKVLLAKWMSAGPAVMLLHEPTQAVDVGARRDILLAVRRAAATGVAVVLVSAEPSDLCAVCDRILVAEPDGGIVDAGTRDPDALLEHLYAVRPDHENQQEDRKVALTHG